MTQWTFAGAGPGRIPLTTTTPIALDTQGTWLVRNLSVDNGTALSLDIEGPDGSIYQIVPPYQTRTFTTIAWTGFQVAIDPTNIGVIQATDILNIYASDGGQPPGYSSYGPASWGGGSVPNSLVNVLGGQGFFAWQIQQIINLLTGVMTGQAVTIANSITLVGNFGVIARFMEVIGATAGVIYFDQDGVGNDSFTIQLQSGALNFFDTANNTNAMSLTEAGALTLNGTLATLILNDTDGIGGDHFNLILSNGLFAIQASVPSTSLLTIDETGITTILGSGASLRLHDQAGGGKDFAWLASGGQIYLEDFPAGLFRLSIGPSAIATSATRLSAVVGASAKTLLNYVPLTTYVETTLNVTGDQAAKTAFTVNGLPSSAVALAGWVQLVGGTLPAGAILALHSGTGAGNLVQMEVETIVAGQFAVMTLHAACTAGATNQLAYTMAGSGGVAWILNLFLTGYFEPT